MTRHAQKGEAYFQSSLFAQLEMENQDT
jgi:hypothetical protein